MFLNRKAGLALIIGIIFMLSIMNVAEAHECKTKKFTTTERTFLESYRDDYGGPSYKIYKEVIRTAPTCNEKKRGVQKQVVGERLIYEFVAEEESAYVLGEVKLHEENGRYDISCHAMDLVEGQGLTLIAGCHDQARFFDLLGDNVGKKTISFSAYVPNFKAQYRT